MAANDALEKKVKELEDCARCELVDAGVDVELLHLNDEIRRLQAENLALRSALHCMHLLTACSLNISQQFCAMMCLMSCTACLQDDLIYIKRKMYNF